MSNKQVLILDQYSFIMLIHSTSSKVIALSIRIIQLPSQAI